MPSDNQLEIIVKRIVEFYSPEKIILFGSMADGTASLESDIDLLLVKKTDVPPVERAAGIRKSLKDILLPLDILVFTPDEIAKDVNRKFSFIYQVMKSGKVVYARP